MRAAAFVRPSGADGAGHVGWAFDISAGGADAGGVENPLGWPSCDPADMGFWSTAQVDPIPPMLSRNYTALKYVDLDLVDVNSAATRVAWVATRPYSVIGRNCMDDVYDVLRAYGVRDLPPPAWHWLPNEWFAVMMGIEAPLQYFQWHVAPPTPLEEAPRLPEAPPVPPPWRVPGTPEWHDLQAQLAAASDRPPYVHMATRRKGALAPGSQPYEWSRPTEP